MRSTEVYDLSAQIRASLLAQATPFPSSLLPPASSPDAHPQHAGRHAPLRATVVVVDDEIDIRTTLADILECEGYSVLQACNGLEALHVLHSLGRTPALILLDMMMPVMNGEEFLRVLRENHKVPAVPVVVLTAAKPSHDATTGARICLHKPISLEYLLRVLERLCPRE
jgi:CheY-like chemotaxis protein